MKPFGPFAHVRGDVAHVELTRTAAPSSSVAQIYEAHGDFVWASLHRMGVRPADVADLSQEVFLIVHRRLDSWNPDARITTWLFGICLKVAAAYRRRAWFRRERSGDMDDERASAATPEDCLVLSDAERRLAQVLDGLSPEQRALFVLFEFEEKSCAELADLFGVPVGTVHSRLHAARKDFQKSLERINARSLGTSAIASRRRSR